MRHFPPTKGKCLANFFSGESHTFELLSYAIDVQSRLFLETAFTSSLGGAITILLTLRYDSFTRPPHPLKAGQNWGLQIV